MRTLDLTATEPLSSYLIYKVLLHEKYFIAQSMHIEHASPQAARLSIFIGKSVALHLHEGLLKEYRIEKSLTGFEPPTSRVLFCRSVLYRCDPTSCHFNEEDKNTRLSPPLCFKPLLLS